MMPRLTNPPGWFLATLFALGMFSNSSRAFPPAPHHRLYGMVRDAFGEPLKLQNATIVFESTNGVQVLADVVPGLAPGINYSLNLAMDSGIAPDTYKPTALQPTLPFRVRVKIGETTYLPIEMVGDYAHLGQPAASTRIDLTLGVDSDNDGLPDDWERLLISQLGLGHGTLADIRPGDDSDGDGISNLDEYRAGTFAFDPAGGFRLNLVTRAGGAPLLEFMTIQPRTYTVYASTDLQTWTPLPFRLPAEGPSAEARLNYTAPDVRVVQVEPVVAEDTPVALSFFKVEVR